MFLLSNNIVNNEDRAYNSNSTENSITNTLINKNISLIDNILLTNVKSNAIFLLRFLLRDKHKSIRNHT